MQHLNNILKQSKFHTMKHLFKTLSVCLVWFLLPGLTQAQEKNFNFQPTDIPNWRPYDQRGVNVFEAPKDEMLSYNGMALRFGAGFTQPFQSLTHSNTLDSMGLYKRLAPGFAVAMANLYMDAVLAKGITLNVTTYLSSRHHNEAWVKGGYLQIDRFPFEGQFWDDLSKLVTLKVGHMEVNYGDQHFRRSDGGHTLYNPFIENYIMDAFATEVAGEVYVTKSGFLGMLGLSNGLINGGHQEPLIKGTNTTYKRNPSIYGKIAYDKMLNEKVRVRGALSAYHNSSDGRSTLYGGDRTGSNYYFVMENEGATSAANAFSGRFNPNFTNQITAIQFNAFVKAYGLEVFGTYENAKGRTIDEKQANLPKRSVNQIGIDAIYRIGAKENLFIGGRYNTVKGNLLTSTNEQSIDRIAVGAGWFLTQNIMLKGEYVTQKYKDFTAPSILTGGEFKGVVIEAAIGF